VCEGQHYTPKEVNPQVDEVAIVAHGFLADEADVLMKMRDLFIFRSRGSFSNTTCEEKAFSP
jgi:hypothetical protein